MALTFTGTGGLFVRAGIWAGGLADVVALMGGTATARVLSGSSFATRGTTIETKAAESPAVSSAIDGHWNVISAFQQMPGQIFQGFISLAEKELIKQVNDDAALPSLTLTAALVEIIRQMRSTGDDINASSVAAGSQTSVGSPVGTPVAVVSLKNVQGWKWQTCFAETLRLTCVADALSGGQTARRESLSILGKAAATSVYDYRYPLGSACSKTLTLVDAALDNSGGNKLTNSDFESATTSNTFDNWTYQTGAAGTDIFAGSSSNAYIGSNCLKLTGDGSTLIKLYQAFNTTASTTAGGGGTPGTLSPLKQYAVFGKIKVSATASAGVLRVALVNSSGTIIADDSGTDNSFTVDITAQTTAYATFSGTFRTPTNMPSAYRLELKTTTAIQSGKSAYIDSLAFAEMTSLYDGGPSICLFAGDTNTVAGDAWTIAITNTIGVMADWMERMFLLRSKGLIIPYDEAAGETVADSLVT